MINLTPDPNYPTYPPYHIGLYLEDYFMNYVNENKIVLNREYIKVGWTSYYNNRQDRSYLKNYLSSLPLNKKYFTVCQHDDAPQESLPPDTLIFCAGGNYRGTNKIPIPLICSKIPNCEFKEKNIFCSFVGSITHPIREKMVKTFYSDSEFYFYASNWTPLISKNQFNIFMDITPKSKFVLCPRGYGNTSFRLYETMQLNSVPVYISDDHALPWSDELNWNEFCVIVKDENIFCLKQKLKSISDIEYNKMLEKIKFIYNDYFSLDGVCKQIIKRVQTI
jgi:hypothetical protein